MSFLNAFVLSVGALLATTAIVTGWLFRTSAAPLWQKLAIPAVLVGLACYLPESFGAMLGFPVLTSFDQLPQKAELVAFVAHDDTHVADLWLRDGEIPRAYETPLDAQMKKTLREAQERQARGERTMLMKRGMDEKKGNSPGVLAEDITHTPSMYVIDPSAFSLPSKGDEQ